MGSNNNLQHWSQLTAEDQIRFWQSVDQGDMSSFLVTPEKKSTRRRRGEHSTKPKCENPSWFRPAHYKALGGQLGHAYNRLVKKDPVTGRYSLRMHMSLHPFYVRERQRGMPSGRRNNACSMPCGLCWSVSATRANIPWGCVCPDWPENSAQRMQKGMSYRTLKSPSPAFLISSPNRSDLALLAFLKKPPGTVNPVNGCPNTSG